MSTHTRKGFIVVDKDDKPHVSTFNEDSEMSRAKMELRTRQTWESLMTIGGYSIRSCTIEIELDEVLGNGGEPIREINEDKVRADK